MILSIGDKMLVKQSDHRFGADQGPCDRIPAPMKHFDSRVNETRLERRVVELCSKSDQTDSVQLLGDKSVPELHSRRM